QRKAADVILVTVAEHQGIDGPHAVDIREKSGRRALAEVEHQAPAGCLDQEAGRPLGADTGNKPQRSRSIVHGVFDHIWPSSATAPTLTTGAPLRINRAAGKEAMKVRNSLKSLRSRHRDNRIVRRKGRVYVINKTQRRFKARQGESVISVAQ